MPPLASPEVTFCDVQILTLHPRNVRVLALGKPHRRRMGSRRPAGGIRHRLVVIGIHRSRLHRLVHHQMVEEERNQGLKLRRRAGPPPSHYTLLWPLLRRARGGSSSSPS